MGPVGSSTNSTCWGAHSPCCHNSTGDYSNTQATTVQPGTHSVLGWEGAHIGGVPCPRTQHQTTAAWDVDPRPQPKVTGRSHHAMTPCMYMEHTFRCRDTEGGHCQGVCHPQRFFYVPLQVTEMARGHVSQERYSTQSPTRVSLFCFVTTSDKTNSLTLYMSLEPGAQSISSKLYCPLEVEPPLFSILHWSLLPGGGLWHIDRRNHCTLYILHGISWYNSYDTYNFRLCWKDWYTDLECVWKVHNQCFDLGSVIAVISIACQLLTTAVLPIYVYLVQKAPLSSGTDTQVAGLTSGRATCV